MANGESATSTTRVRDNAATPDCAPPQSQDPVNRGAGSVLLSTGEVRFRRLAAATDKAQKTLDGSCFDIQSVHDFETHVRTMMDDTSTTVLPALVGQSSDSSDDFSDDFGLPRPPPEPPPSRRPRRRWERRHSSGRLRSVCSPQPVPSSRPRRHVGESAASRGDVGLAEGHGAELRSHGGCSEEMVVDFASRGGCWLRQVQITLLSACTVPQWWFRKSGGAAVQGCVEWHAGRRFQHRSSWLSGCC